MKWRSVACNSMKNKTSRYHYILIKMVKIKIVAAFLPGEDERNCMIGALLIGRKNGIASYSRR